jgi:WXXGXW repeat (2 copies)
MKQTPFIQGRFSMFTSFTCTRIGGVMLPWVLVAASAVLMQQKSHAQDPGAPPAGPDDGTVVERGPVHEAYAQPSQVNPKPPPPVPRQPPEPVPEQPPDQRPEGANVQWIPGYWSWDADRKDFVWVSGFWRVPPPDRKWVPGHWAHGDAGWQWTAGFWMADDQHDLPIVPPPPVSPENGPSVPAPSDDSFYVPGGWVYQDARYLWRPGFWSTAYPDWVWVPGCYRWTPAGYYFVNGYWDYPLYNRGLLFAPVWFHRPFWLTSGWFYRPRFVVSLGFDSLFINPLWGSYYFGNYYAPFYAGLGFYPWYRYGPRYYDPFFAHAYWLHRHDAGWLPGLRSTFLARQQAVEQGLTAGGVGRGAIAGTQAGLPRTVVPLSQFQNRNLALAGVSATQRAQERVATRSYQQASASRARLENASGRSSVRPATVFGSLPGSRPAGTSPAYQPRLAGSGQRTAFYGSLGNNASRANVNRRFDAGSIRSGSVRSTGVNEVWSFHEPHYQPGRASTSFSSGSHWSGTVHPGLTHGGGGVHASGSHHSAGGSSHGHH